MAIAAGSSSSALAATKPARKGLPLPQLYRGWDARNFEEIKNDEDVHVTFLVKALGASARPMPTFQNLQATTYKQFAALSQAFENTGVGAYLGALPYIFEQAYVSAGRLDRAGRGVPLGLLEHPAQ